MPSPDNLLYPSPEHFDPKEKRAPNYNPRNMEDLYLGTGGALGAVGGLIGIPMAVWINVPEAFNIYSALALAPVGLTLGGGVGFAMTYLGFKGYERFIQRK